MDMTGKTVLITGASRGIGAAAGRVFAGAGANVVLAARSAGALADLARDIGPRAVPVACDVACYKDVAKAVETCTDRFGGLDVLIGNAGVIDPIAPLSDIDPAAWRRVIDINLTGAFHGMRAALPVMRAAGGGTIITLSSGAAHTPLQGWSHYCASKAGAAMLTQCAHLEAGADGVRVIGLSPGTVATQMQQEVRDSGINPVSQLDWSQHIPPDWPARALLWMCTPEADPWLGRDVSLRDPDIRRKVGLA